MEVRRAGSKTAQDRALDLANVVEFTIDNSGNLTIEKKLPKKDAKQVSNPPAAMDWAAPDRTPNR